MQIDKLQKTISARAERSQSCARFARMKKVGVAKHDMHLSQHPILLIARRCCIHTCTSVRKMRPGARKANLLLNKTRHRFGFIDLAAKVCNVPMWIIAFRSVGCLVHGDESEGAELALWRAPHTYLIRRLNRTH